MKYSIFVFLVFIVVMTISVFAAEEVKVPAYAGDNAKNCKMCHKDIVAKWETMSKAKAYDTLSDEDKAKPECISCHVTGAGVEGGFISAEKSPTLLNVQCEACHGPAADHMKSPAKVEPSKDPKTSCADCHNEKFAGFKKDEWKLDEALASIKHWKDE